MSIGSGSTTRFLLAEDAAALLGEDCRIAGLYELPLLLREQTVLCGATDLCEYDSVFPLRFVAYGEITEASLGEVALITHRLAAERGLSVGDTLTATVLGRAATYTVAGIADMPFAGSYDVLLDISAVTHAIAAGSPFLSAIGDSFRPAGTLYIDLPDGRSAQEAAHRLALSPLFADKSIIPVSSYVETLSAIHTVDMIVAVIILLTAVLGAAVTFCCFSILSSARSEENAVFLAAGVRRLPLALLMAVPLLAVPMLLVPPTARFALDVACFLVLVLLVFTLTPPLFRTILHWVSLRQERGRRQRGRAIAPSLYYAVKNTEAVTLLQNSARLVAVLLTVLTLTSYLLTSTFGFLGTLRELFSGEYAVSGGTARCYEQVVSCASVGRVNRIYLSSVNVSDAQTCTALAADDVALLMAAIIFSVVGLLDNLVESYRSRREEFSLYAASGMSAHTIRRMKCAEVGITLLFALLVSLIATAIGIGLMQYTLSSLHDVLLNFQRL